MCTVQYVCSIKHQVLAVYTEVIHSTQNTPEQCQNEVDDLTDEETVVLPLLVQEHILKTLKVNNGVKKTYSILC